MSVKLSPAIGAIFLVVVWGFMFTFGYLDKHFIAHNPPRPDSTTGHIIEKTFDHGKYVRYLSADEDRAYNALGISVGVTLVVFFVLIIIRKREQRREET